MCLYVFIDGKLKGTFQEEDFAKAIALASLARNKGHVYDDNKNLILYFKRGPATNSKVLTYPNDGVKKYDD